LENAVTAFSGITNVIKPNPFCLLMMNFMNEKPNASLSEFLPAIYLVILSIGKFTSAKGPKGLNKFSKSSSVTVYDKFLKNKIVSLIN